MTGGEESRLDHSTSQVSCCSRVNQISSPRRSLSRTNCYRHQANNRRKSSIQTPSPTYTLIIPLPLAYAFPASPCSTISPPKISSAAYGKSLSLASRCCSVSNGLMIACENMPPPFSGMSSSPSPLSSPSSSTSSSSSRSSSTSSSDPSSPPTAISLFLARFFGLVLFYGRNVMSVSSWRESEGTYLGPNGTTALLRFSIPTRQFTFHQWHLGFILNMSLVHVRNEQSVERTLDPAGRPRRSPPSLTGLGTTTLGGSSSPSLTLFYTFVC
jgi:hypothetical protein